MEPVKVDTKVLLTPPRPKRYSPSFDRDEEDDFALGRRSPGEGTGTGVWSHVMSSGPDSPSTAKRRRIELWGFSTPSTVSSCSGTPSRGTTPDTTLEDSVLSTPSDSPAGTMTKEDRRDFKKRYKKDELWPAIESNYQYLMDDEIIETCKSTESDLSWDEDDNTINTKVSFTEFMQQYKELTDWLNQIQTVTQRNGTSRSEKYLNQAYHEELLQSSPRRKLFNEYAKQLLKRYPSLKEEITLRLQHVNSQWQTLQENVGPANGHQDTKTMLHDLDLDLSCIRSWLNGVEGRLLTLCINPTWIEKDIELQLKEHQVLQREIESQSKVISAVLKLSERLQNYEWGVLDEEAQEESDRHQITAVKLEKRWHNVWLRSLEWQCRLEEALTQLKCFGGKPLHSSDPSLWHDFDQSSSFLEGFNSDDQEILSHDLVCSDSEPSDTCEDQGLSSEEPNSSDVIPFYDEEYEKIQDVDEPTAEDREVQLLSDEMREKIQGSKLLHASSLAKSDSNLSEFKSEIMDTLDETKFGRGSFFNSKMKSGRSESRDIGYSSEGYSNDEQLDPSDHIGLMRTPSLNGLNYSKHESYSKSGLLIVSENGVVRRRPASLPLDGNLGSLTTSLTNVNKDSPWRHSITSAYDTSSNCGSDPEALINNDGGSSIDPNAENSNYKAIINSPTKEFYKMITVDTDFSTDRNDTDEQLSSNDHGSSPKLRCNQSETSIDIPDEVHPYLPYNATNHMSGNKFLGSISEIVQSENSIQSGTDNEKLIDSGLFLEDLERGVIALEKETLQSNGENQICHFLKENQLSNKTDDFCGQGESKWTNGSKDKVRKPKSKRRLGLETADSVTGTDTSSPRSGTDSILDSSCEASGEETSYSESSDEDFSTASDHEDNCSSMVFSSYNTLVGSDKNLADKNNSPSAIYNTGMPRSSSSYSNSDACKMRTKIKGRRNRRDRPWSIVAVSDLKNQLNAKDKPVFISESAIDTINYHSNSSDCPPHSSTPIVKNKESSLSSPSAKQYATFPRDKSKPPRSRHMRRTKSVEDQENKLKIISNSSKRKLAYDNSAHNVSHIPSACHPISIVVSSPDVEMNRSYMSEEGFAPLSLIEGLEHIKVYSSGSGSDTDLGAYMTPKQSLSESGSESDDFVNSTGSFSETAWDNYQDPLYPTASEAPTEEPLHWEPQDEMEFEEEEFKVDSEAIKLSAKVIAERSDQIRSKERKSSTYACEDDSDSDLEDLHHVIQQSFEHLQVTDSSLKKQRRDPMGTGISLDPSKYAEHVLTCETNLRCLEDVLDLPMISGHEAHQIQVLLNQWKQLCTFAVDRREQSQQLCCMYGDLTKVKTTVSEVMKNMIVGSFEEVTQLEAAVKTLQTKTTNLCTDCDRLRAVKESVSEFSLTNPTIAMDQFKTKSVSSANLLGKTAKRCQNRVKELERLLRKWYDYQEKSKELSYVLNKERKQLQFMEFSQSLMLEKEGGELQSKIQDLKVISSDLEAYDVKLTELRDLKEQLNDICSDEAKCKMEVNLSTFSSELFALTQWCDENFARLVEKEGEENVIKSLAAAQSASPNQGRSLHRYVSILLKGAAPVVVMAALMYLAAPDSWENLSEFGFTISTELRHLKGPPPT